MTGKLTVNWDKTITVETQNEIIKYQFASFGDRLGARLIDVFIIIIPSACIPLLPAWLYFSLQHSGKKQATVGQNAVGIKLLSLDGEKISFGQATGRFFGNILNTLTFFIGYFMFFFDDKNRCLHDLLSGCIVVKEIGRNDKNGFSNSHSLPYQLHNPAAKQNY